MFQLKECVFLEKFSPLNFRRGALSLMGRRVLLTRHFDDSLSVYLFLEFEPQLGKSEKFNNQGMKENKAFRVPFITKKQLKSRQALHRLFWKPQCKIYRMPRSSISKISQPPNGKQCCLPPLSFKISLKANISNYQTPDLNKQQRN